ncbi:hypothetical protein ACFO5O_12740 [Geojedonia litorea]|uniref:Fibronectin type-III domain-containing protein n=1 Tax=Geojedonia litorea TaxID=1268269 RepID=A0ABV9N6F9_9FLAO
MKKFLFVNIFVIFIYSCSGGSGEDITPPDEVNVAPSTPTLVYPTNNLLCLDSTLDFLWNASIDVNNDPITYTIQVSKDNLFGQINYSANSASLNQTFTLEKGIAYYWRVKASDNRNASSEYSSTFNFYTEGDGISNHLPFSPELVRPLLNNTIQEGTTTLEWTASDTDGDPLIFDVYFGTNNPPVTLVSENQNATFLNVTTVSATNYYWKIVVKDDAGGNVIGQVWSFSTD